MTDRGRDLPVLWGRSPWEWFDRVRGRMVELLDELDLAGRQGWGWLSSRRPGLAGLAGTWRLDLDVRDAGDHYEITLDLPGVDREDLQITAYEDRLVIQGERRSEWREETDGVLSAERFFGRFYRQVPLLPDMDGERITAELQNGVLRLTIPKTEPSQGRRIEIQ